jgi:chromosome segregation ATPase
MNGTISPDKRRPSTALMPHNGTVRRVSGGIENNATSETPRAGTLSPTGENGQWSSAIGHATTTGKSGRVIERLMAENDRLKKDLELQLLRSQELERNLQTMRPQLDALRTENDNLSHANSMETNLLSRRDRRIEQLKEEVASERSRREASERLARQHEREKDEMQEQSRRDVQRALEESKHSTTHASILEQSHHQLSTEYRQRAERWRKEVAVLHAQRQADDAKVARLEVISEQMATELEQTRTLQAEYQKQYQEYKTATEEWKVGLESVANNEQARTRKLSEDMLSTTKQMKWVMANEKVREGG